MRFFKHFSRPGAKKDRIYLDYASSTPLDRDMLVRVPKIDDTVLAANPSALHKEGAMLHRVLEAARRTAAEAFEVHPDEVIFTSGATESDNLVIVGTVYGWMRSGIRADEIALVTSELEHAAVGESVARLTGTGVRTIVLPIEGGVVHPKDIVLPSGVKAMLVSVMYVSNEIGTVQPIREMAARIRKLRKEHPGTTILFHTDASQAPAHFSLRVPSLGVDLLTLGATKLYCRKGVGLLFKKRGVSIAAMLSGGGQELGFRPGTEPVELINEFAYSLEWANSLREKETQRVKELQMYFESEIERNFPQLRITAKESERTPHITHIGVPDFDSELLVLELDARGIAVSAKSACKNEEGNESAIVEKLYGKGFGAIRFSFGRMTTKAGLDRAIEALQSVLKKYQKMK